MTRRPDPRLRLARGLFFVLVFMATAAFGATPALPAPASERYVIVPAESSVGYRVGEVFLNDNNRFHVAVGTTQIVRGEIVVNRANPAESHVGTIVVDISRLASDSARRDNAIRARWLESERFPNATFSPTAIRGLPERIQDGEEIAFSIIGSLKVRDVARETVFATKLKLDGARLSGAATADVKMTDFGFQPPSIFGVLRSENDVKIEIRFVAQRVP